MRGFLIITSRNVHEIFEAVYGGLKKLLFTSYDQACDNPSPSSG